jgi:hypothetical protein
MANQETGKSRDGIFTAGDVRVLADFVRAVANGTFTTAELQTKLNERKVTDAQMPAFIRMQWEIDHASGSIKLKLLVFEKSPPKTYGSAIDCFTTIESITVGERWFANEWDLGTYADIYSETDEWGYEAGRRLRQSCGSYISVSHFRRDESGAWKEIES